MWRGLYRRVHTDNVMSCTHPHLTSPFLSPLKPPLPHRLFNNQPTFKRSTFFSAPSVISPAENQQFMGKIRDVYGAFHKSHPHFKTLLQMQLTLLLMHAFRNRTMLEQLNRKIRKHSLFSTRHWGVWGCGAGGTSGGVRVRLAYEWCAGELGAGRLDGACVWGRRGADGMRVECQWVEGGEVG